MLLLAGHAQTAFYAIMLGGAWSIYWGLFEGERSAKFNNLVRTIGDLQVLVCGRLELVRSSSFQRVSICYSLSELLNMALKQR
jgi:hypothetical protein